MQVWLQKLLLSKRVGQAASQALLIQDQLSVAHLSSTRAEAPSRPPRAQAGAQAAALAKATADGAKEAETVLDSLLTDAVSAAKAAPHGAASGAAASEAITAVTAPARATDTAAGQMADSPLQAVSEAKATTGRQAAARQQAFTPVTTAPMAEKGTQHEAAGCLSTGHAATAATTKVQMPEPSLTNAAADAPDTQVTSGSQAVLVKAVHAVPNMPEDPLTEARGRSGKGKKGKMSSRLSRSGSAAQDCADAPAGPILAQVLHSAALNSDLEVGTGPSLDSASGAGAASPRVRAATDIHALEEVRAVAQVPQPSEALLQPASAKASKKRKQPEAMHNSFGARKRKLARIKRQKAASLAAAAAAGAAAAGRASSSPQPQADSHVGSGSTILNSSAAGTSDTDMLSTDNDDEAGSLHPDKRPHNPDAATQHGSVQGLSKPVDTGMAAASETTTSNKPVKQPQGGGAIQHGAPLGDAALQPPHTAAAAAAAAHAQPSQQQGVPKQQQGVRSPSAAAADVAMHTAAAAAAPARTDAQLAVGSSRPQPQKNGLTSEGARSHGASEGKQPMKDGTGQGVVESAEASVDDLGREGADEVCV